MNDSQSFDRVFISEGFHSIFKAELTVMTEIWFFFLNELQAYPAF